MNFSKRRQTAVGGAKNKSKQFSVALNTFYSTHRRLDWYPYSFGHPNVDFSAAPIILWRRMLPSATLNTFPAANAAYIRRLLLYHGVKRRLEHFPSSLRRLCRRHHPKTAPRQLQSKSRFFEPCISQKDSQWRQRRHVRIYKKLFKEGPHQNEILHYVIGVIAYLFITQNPTRKKKSSMFLPSSAASNFF